MSEPLAPQDVTQRASVGAAMLGARGAVILAFGLAGTVALAALLEPREFGLLALGNVLIFIGRSLSEGGLVAGFIGRDRVPDRRDLEAGLGFQLAITVGLAVAASAVALPFGDEALVLALMAWSVPITSLRLPSSLLLERELRYGPVAVVETVEAVSFYVLAVGLVVAGLGVWGVAAAAVLRAVLATVVMARVGPAGWVRPQWDPGRIRGVLGFGVRFQQAAAVNLVREQGLTMGIAAIAGLSVVGIWTLAHRVLQAPLMLFTALKRIGFPAMARLLEGGTVSGAMVERAVALVAVVGTLLVAPLVAVAPAAFPLVLGPEWEGVPPVLLWGALGLLVGTPVATVATGYLYAIGDTRAVVRVVAARSVAWLVVALALVAPLGPAAVGLGWVASGMVEAFGFGRAARHRTGARLAGPAGLPVAVAAGAGTAGYAIGSAGDPSVWLAVGAGLAALAIAMLGLLVTNRPALREALRSARAAF